MALVDIDDEIHRQIKKIVEEQKVDYPTIQFYVNRAIKNQLRIDVINYKETQQ